MKANKNQQVVEMSKILNTLRRLSPQMWPKHAGVPKTRNEILKNLKALVGEHFFIYVSHFFSQISYESRKF